LTNSPALRETSPHRVLLSCGHRQDVARWVFGVDDLLRPSGVLVRRAHTGPDTIRCIEEGGLGAAVVCADAARIDALSVLRIIRSIDLELPCWLVTKDTTRQTFQTALSLKVTSVITHPDRVGELTQALRKVLANRAMGN
jgi:CheY-like chemotaxis protein